MSLFLLIKVLVIIISSNNDIYGNTVTVALARIEDNNFFDRFISFAKQQTLVYLFCLLWYLLLYWSAGTNVDQ